MKLLSNNHVAGLLGLGIKPILKPDVETVTTWVERDGEEDSVEVITEVLYAEPPSQGGCSDERLGWQIQLGASFRLNGDPEKLSELERESAEEEYIANQSKAAEDFAESNIDTDRD